MRTVGENNESGTDTCRTRETVKFRLTFAVFEIPSLSKWKCCIANAYRPYQGFRSTDLSWQYHDKPKVPYKLWKKKRLIFSVMYLFIIWHTNLADVSLSFGLLLLSHFETLFRLSWKSCWKNYLPSCFFFVLLCTLLKYFNIYRVTCTCAILFTGFLIGVIYAIGVTY